jgi:hypothetical protein
MIAPLILNDFPMTGPSGERDNVARLYVILGSLLPRGSVAMLTIAHDDPCPCADGDRPVTACTCHLVDVTVRLHDPRRS